MPATQRRWRMRLLHPICPASARGHFSDPAIGPQPRQQRRENLVSGSYPTVFLIPSGVMNTILIDKTQDGYVITYIVGAGVKLSRELVGVKSEPELTEILRGEAVPETG